MSDNGPGMRAQRDNARAGEMKLARELDRLKAKIDRFHQEAPADAITAWTRACELVDQETMDETGRWAEKWLGIELHPWQERFLSTLNQLAESVGELANAVNESLEPSPVVTPPSSEESKGECEGGFFDVLDRGTGDDG